MSNDNIQTKYCIYKMPAQKGLTGLGDIEIKKHHDGGRFRHA